MFLSELLAPLFFPFAPCPFWGKGQIWGRVECCKTEIFVGNTNSWYLNCHCKFADFCWSEKRPFFKLLCTLSSPALSMPAVIAVPHGPAWDLLQHNNSSTLTQITCAVEKITQDNIIISLFWGLEVKCLWSLASFPSATGERKKQSSPEDNL